MQPYARAPRLRLPRDAPVADGLPAVPAAATALLRVLLRWTVRLLLPRQLAKARLAYLHAAREHLATPLHPSAVETLEWLFPERKRLAEPGAGARRRHATSTSRAPIDTPRFRALYRQWLDDPTNTLWMAGSRIIADASTAGTDGSSASSCRGNTCISLPWLTSPDSNSRGRPGGRPRKSRSSPRRTSCRLLRHDGRCERLRLASRRKRFSGHGFRANAPMPRTMGGALCRPLQVPVPRSEQETMA